VGLWQRTSQWQGASSQRCYLDETETTTKEKTNETGRRTRKGGRRGRDPSPASFLGKLLEVKEKASQRGGKALLFLQGKSTDHPPEV
jgi:hypothetical protein